MENETFTNEDLKYALTACIHCIYLLRLSVHDVEKIDNLEKSTLNLSLKIMRMIQTDPT